MTNDENDDLALSRMISFTDLDLLNFTNEELGDWNAPQSPLIASTGTMPSTGTIPSVGDTVMDTSVRCVSPLLHKSISSDGTAEVEEPDAKRRRLV